MKLSITVTELDNEYIANCPELEINCYGEDKIDAVRRIKNVLQFYIASAQELGFDVEDFDAMVVEGVTHRTLINNMVIDTPPLIN
jgi:predicted RNase H-like HicB family nuclease